MYKCGLGHSSFVDGFLSLYVHAKSRLQRKPHALCVPDSNAGSCSAARFQAACSHDAHTTNIQSANRSALLRIKDCTFVLFPAARG